MECDLRVDIELKLEVHTGNALGVDLGTEQEPGLRIAIRLLPQNKRTCSQDCTQESQNRRVSFRMPKDEDSVTRELGTFH